MQTVLVVGHGHLWYLYASAFATLLIALLIKYRIRMGRIVAIGICLYFIGALDNAYAGLLTVFHNNSLICKVQDFYHKLFISTQNGLFFGFFFVGLGAFFAYKDIHMKKHTALIGLIGSICLLFLEAYIVNVKDLASGHSMYIFLIPAVFFLFYIVLHVEVRESTMLRNLRTYSSLIYYTHMWVYFPILTAITKAINVLSHNSIQIHSILKFVFIMTGSLVLSSILIKLSQSKRFGWLHMLY